MSCHFWSNECIIAELNNSFNNNNKKIRIPNFWTVSVCLRLQVIFSHRLPMKSLACRKRNRFLLFMSFLKLFYDWVHLACSRPFKKSFSVRSPTASQPFGLVLHTQPLYCMWPGITHSSLYSSLSATYQVLILSPAPSISFHSFIPLSFCLFVS